jgi:hypothetical protein
VVERRKEANARAGKSNTDITADQRRTIEQLAAAYANAAAAAEFWPLLEAMNSGRMPAFANGGLVARRVPAPTLGLQINPASKKF